MDYQAFVDMIAVPCAVVSVERTAEGGCGAVRYAKVNRAFLELRKGDFREGMLYHGDRQRDLRFEEFCFRAAFHGQRIYDYTESAALGVWGDIVMLPLAREREDLGYCQFMIELTTAADPRRMATVSAETSVAVIRECIQLMAPKDFHSRVGDVLRDIVDSTDALAGRVILTDREKQTVRTFCECFREGAPLPAPEEGVPWDIVRSWQEIAGITRTLIVTNAQEMKILARYNPAMAEHMRACGAKSLLLVPLRRRSLFVGYLYLVDFRVQDVVEIKERVELISFFLGSETANQLLVTRLETISHTDALTGLRNRSAMNRRLHALTQSEKSPPFGVINLDLNGLKDVNDSEGHEAGDRLLLRAAETLSGLASRENVYRTGGDEFIIVADGMDEAAFARLTETLRAAGGEGAELSFALGACWSDGTLSLTELFRTADARMYEDKKAFYARHPERKRR